MKILIIDECFYTRSGVNTYLNSVSSIKLMDVPTVEEATLAIQEFQPDIIIVNLTQYCRYGGHCPLLAQFIHYCTRAKVYMSLSIILCNCHRIKGDRSGGHRTR